MSTDPKDAPVKHQSIPGIEEQTELPVWSNPPAEVPTPDEALPLGGDDFIN